MIPRVFANHPSLACARAFSRSTRFTISTPIQPIVSTTLHGMSSEVVIRGALYESLRTFEENDEFEQAQIYFSEFEKSACASSFGLIIDWCKRLEFYDQGVFYFNKMIRLDLIVPIDVYNSRIEISDASCFFDEAEGLFKEMAANQIVPNRRTFNAMLSVSLNTGNIESLFEYSERMTELGLEFDRYTYEHVISGCEYSKFIMGGQKLYEEALEKGLFKPWDDDGALNLSSYSIPLVECIARNALSTIGPGQTVLRIRGLSNESNTDTISTYSAFIDLLKTDFPLFALKPHSSIANELILELQ